MRDDPTPPTVSLPPQPEERRAAPPSLLAILVPLAGSLLLWALTGSALSLAFAALGPALLLAGSLEARWRLRGDRRRDEARYAERLAGVEKLIDDLHGEERRRASARTPSVRDRLAQPENGARWRTSPTEALLVVLGSAELPSLVRVVPERAGPESAVVDRLRLKARALPDAPLTVDLRRGLCVVGRGAAADALVRSVLLQAVCRVPASARVDVAGNAEAWLEAVPHPVRARLGRAMAPEGIDAARFVVDDGGVPAAVIRLTDAREVPTECDTVVTVTAGGGRVLRHSEVPRATVFVPDTVSAIEAVHLAGALAAAAPSGRGGIPDRVPLASLLGAAPRGAPDSAGGGAAVTLRCPIGVGPGGTVNVDLISDGPHAVVAGTTGSGKSELLRSWVLALACLHPPSAVQFLLLDFKGGASFSGLEELPHTVGVVTDLDGGTAQRAVLSLRAELRHREQVLAASGSRSIDDGRSGLARLVLVIDEFAALAEQQPESHAVLSDVAARGRSLGMHLILCTQRPAGVVRDGLLANAGLRLCLRVTSADDSRDLVGVPDASRLGRPGRVVLTSAASAPVQMQVAEADGGLATEISAAWPAAPIRRPWLPELPASIDLAALPAGDGIVFGLGDRPEEQARVPAVWQPRRAGCLLVLGGPASGRSTALAAVAAAAGAPPAIWPRPTLPCVWDAVTAALDRLDAGEPDPRLLLLDDIDAVMSAAGGEYGHELAERLLRILREGAHAGVSVAMTASRLPAALSGAVALAGSRLILRTASRDEHRLAGGTPALFRASAPPGRGELGGMLVQVADARRTVAPPDEREEAVAPTPGLLVVSSRPAALEGVLGAGAVRRLGGPEPPQPVGSADAVLIGSPDEWQSRWSVLRQLAATRPVLFDGCGPADARSLLGRQELPPPCAGRARWLFRPGEPAVRARLGPAR